MQGLSIKTGRAPLPKGKNGRFMDNFKNIKLFLLELFEHGEIRTHDFLSNRFQDDRIKPLYHTFFMFHYFFYYKAR